MKHLLSLSKLCDILVYCFPLTIILACPALLDTLWFLVEFSSNTETIALKCIRFIYIIAGSFLVSILFSGAALYIQSKSKRWGYIYRWMTLAFSFILSSIDISLICLFKRRFSATEIELIAETTKDESTGFLKAYCFDSYTLKYLVLFSCIVIFSWIITKIIVSCDKNLKFTKYAIFLLYISSLGLFIQESVAKSIKDQRKFPGLVDSYSTLYNSYYHYLDLKKECDKCGISQLNAVVKQCNFKSDNIIVIIGESFNRHHSSLYNYRLQTNPLLEKQDNLFVFDDVIAPINGTIDEFHNFLSMASVDDDMNWMDCPLVTTLMKKAGYDIYFYSNQFPKSNSTTEKYGGQFLNNTIVDSLSFSFRNNKVFRYDGQLIDYLKNTYKPKKNRHNIVFVHLLGQHICPEDKYPMEFDFFDIKDYSRPELTETERKQIAYYDNATLYNDSVVKSIFDYFYKDDAILLYFADHGDEANDFRSHRGRSFDLGLRNKDVLENQLDIPFLICTTPLYQKTHPDVIESIKKAQHYPFMIDDFPHLLLGLGGVECEWYNPRRDLLNHKYNINRTRLIGSNYNINYDIVCKHR